MLYFGLRLCIARGVVICGFLSPSSFRQPTLKGTIAQLLPLPVGLAFKGAPSMLAIDPLLIIFLAIMPLLNKTNESEAPEKLGA